MKRLLLLLALASPALAEDNPWSEGVTAETQTQANALFDEANTLFANKDLQPALEKYRAALALWDHPLIRFNLAVTLIRLERIVEAADELDRAMRYGEKPFKPELYQQALDYQTLLKGRVGTVEVACEQAGVTIALDGKRWFDCPGKQTRRVQAGEITISADKPGFLPLTKRVVVAGGKTATESVKLAPIERAAATEVHYKVKPWIPWTIAIGGGAIALGGVGMYLLGRNEMTEFDANFARTCGTTGCEKDLSQHPELKDQRDSAQLKGNIGIGAMIGGGVVMAGGIVFVILNRPISSNVEVAPTPGGAAAKVSWRF